MRACPLCSKSFDRHSNGHIKPCNCREERDALLKRGHLALDAVKHCQDEMKPHMMENDAAMRGTAPTVVEPMITTHPLMKELLALPIYDQCLIHRFLYYVLSRPVMNDREYDMLERDANKELDKMEMKLLGHLLEEKDPGTFSHPLRLPGSDLEASYAPEIAGLAYKIAFPELR